MLKARELLRDVARRVLKVEMLASRALGLGDQVAHEAHELLGVELGVVLEDHAVESAVAKVLNGHIRARRVLDDDALAEVRHLASEERTASQFIDNQKIIE